MAFRVHEAHSCSFQRHHSSVTQNFQVLFLVQLLRTLLKTSKHASSIPLKKRTLKRGSTKHCCGFWLGAVHCE